MDTPEHGGPEVAPIDEQLHLKSEPSKAEQVRLSVVQNTEFVSKEALGMGGRVKAFIGSVWDKFTHRSKSTPELDGLVESAEQRGVALNLKAQKTYQKFLTTEQTATYTAAQQVGNQYKALQKRIESGFYGEVPEWQVLITQATNSRRILDDYVIQGKYRELTPSEMEAFQRERVLFDMMKARYKELYAQQELEMAAAKQAEEQQLDELQEAA